MTGYIIVWIIVVVLYSYNDTRVIIMIGQNAWYHSLKWPIPLGQDIYARHIDTIIGHAYLDDLKRYNYVDLGSLKIWFWRYGCRNMNWMIVYTSVKWMVICTNIKWMIVCTSVKSMIICMIIKWMILTMNILDERLYIQVLIHDHMY